MYLSESQINDYERNGAIVIKGVFKDWIDCLRTGFDKVLAEPSEHGRENVAKGDAGRFFEGSGCGGSGEIKIAHPCPM